MDVPNRGLRIENVTLIERHGSDRIDSIVWQWPNRHGPHSGFLEVSWRETAVSVRFLDLDDRAAVRHILVDVLANWTDASLEARQDAAQSAVHNATKDGRIGLEWNGTYQETDLFEGNVPLPGSPRLEAFWEELSTKGAFRHNGATFRAESWSLHFHVATRSMVREDTRLTVDRLGNAEWHMVWDDARNDHEALSQFRAAWPKDWAPFPEEPRVRASIC